MKPKSNLFVLIEGNMDAVVGPLDPDDFPDSWDKSIGPDLIKLRKDPAIEHYTHAQDFIFVFAHNIPAFLNQLRNHFIQFEKDSLK
jgi:hypothetical protein